MVTVFGMRSDDEVGCVGTVVERIVISCNEEHPENTLLLIDVTIGPNSTLVNCLQLLNRLELIEVKLFGRIIVLIAVSEKAYSSILDMLSCKTMVSKDVHFANAFLPILATVEGIANDVMDEHPENA